jgi:hydroxyversicolorone monooxygenase
MRFNTEIMGCYWNEDDGKWTVKIRETSPGSDPREFTVECDFILHATGLLNNFQWPKISGLDLFKGKVIRKKHCLMVFKINIDYSRYSKVA